MIPSNKWFPRSLTERAAWFQNFAAQFPTVSAGLKLDVYDAQVVNDNKVMQFVADIDGQIKSYESAARVYREIVTEGEPGAPTPTFPAAPALAPPAEGVALTGIFSRLNILVERVKLGDGYTTDIGVLLGFVKSQGTNPNAPETIAEMKPTPTVTALPLAGMQIKFTRGNSDGIVVFIQRANSNDWESVGTFFASPAVITVSLTAPNQPEMIRVRVRYVKGNDQIGDFSDIAQIVVAP